MFQYAVGKSIANQTDSVLKFDITSLEKNQMPYHTLTKNEKISYLKESILGFDLDFTIATNKEIRNVRSIFDERKIRYQPIIKLVSKISPKKKSYYKEKIIHKYDPEIFEKGEHIYLDGTFINPNYFKQIKIL